MTYHTGIRGTDSGWLQRYLLDLGIDVEADDCPQVGTLFTGIGGFDLAFEREGYEVAFQCEIDKAARAVLRHHWPTVRLIEDVKDVSAADGPVDVLVGGFPCQDLSVAGKRAGLAGERSGLFFEFARCIEAVGPRWVVIENVPGLLSSNGGRDMATVLGTLGELGYGWAYRVLDAQYFGVAQRRNRVFIVGCAGGRTDRAAEVLFEPESVCGDTPPSREAGERAAFTLAASVRGSGDGHDNAWNSNYVVPEVAGTLGGASQSGGFRTTDLDNNGAFIVANALTASAGHHGHSSPRGDGSDNLIAIIQDARGVREKKQNGIGIAGSSDPMYTLDGTSQHAVALSGDGTDCTPAVTSKWAKGSGGPAGDECQNLAYIPASVETLAGGAHPGGLNGQEAAQQAIAPHGRVRRLTPTEAERLQGFPDGWTDGQSDSHRYKQLGNAVAVPVVQWIARRIRVAS